MTRPRNAAPADSVETDSLLQALNESNEPATPAAPVTPSDRIELPAGPTKLAIFLPFQIALSRQRADRRQLPVYIVYVIEDGKVQSTHYVHSIRGNLDTVVNLSGQIPGFLPKRLPGTAGVSPNDELPARLDWYLQSTETLTLYTEAREVAPVSVPKVEPQPARDIRFVELPALPSSEFTTPGLSAFIEAVTDAITKAHAARSWSPAAGAAHALSAAAQTLAAVDKMPPAKPRRPGDNIIGGVFDAYPDGSAVARAANDTSLPTTELTAGYLAALGLLGSRALDRDKRKLCEHGANQLMELRQRLRQLAL